MEFDDNPKKKKRVNPVIIFLLIAILLFASFFGGFFIAKGAFTAKYKAELEYCVGVLEANNFNLLVPNDPPPTPVIPG